MPERRPARDGRVYTTIRLDPDLVRRMDEEAEERAVSRTFLIEKALTTWLAAHEGRA
jgi:predicted transcriptional regulator